MYAVVTINVLTESGARYVLRQHGERLYVTRLGDVALNGTAPVNRVTTLPVKVIAVGEPMHIDFPGARFIRTTPVAAFDYRVDRYLAA